MIIKQNIICPKCKSIIGEIPMNNKKKITIKRGTDCVNCGINHYDKIKITCKSCGNKFKKDISWESPDGFIFRGLIDEIEE